MQDMSATIAASVDIAWPAVVLCTDTACRLVSAILPLANHVLMSIIRASSCVIMPCTLA